MKKNPVLTIFITFFIGFVTYATVKTIPSDTQVKEPSTSNAIDSTNVKDDSLPSDYGNTIPSITSTAEILPTDLNNINNTETVKTNTPIVTKTTKKKSVLSKKRPLRNEDYYEKEKDE